MKNSLTLLIFLCTNLISTIGLAQLKIVTTIPDFGVIAAEVGGPHVQVKNLVKPTQDPHFVDPKPSYMVTLNRADILLVTGMDLEAGWLPPLLTGSRNPKIQKGSLGYIDCSTFIQPMSVESVDRAKGDIHPGGNPHYWIDPRNGLNIAKGIAEKLIQLDAKHADDIKYRLNSFISRLTNKMSQWQKQLEIHRGTKVVVYHKSWVYFLDWAGFVRVGALEPKPGIPPKASHVAKLIMKVKGQNVRFVIQESFYPTSLSTLFAQKSNAQLLVLPTMVGGEGTHTYESLIEHIVTRITTPKGEVNVKH